VSTRIGALAALIVLWSGPGAAADPWCASWRDASVAERRSRDDAQALASAIDDQESALRRSVLAELLVDDGGTRAWRLLDEAAVLKCPSSPLPEVESAAALAATVLKDPAFHGERANPDLIDQWIAAAQAWLLSLFESKGMQQYAGISRVLYLGVLAALAAYLAVRLLRERRRRVSREDATSPHAHVELRRKEAAGELLDAAAAALVRGAHREAMRLCERALLVRVGEKDPGAVTPARTHREILDALDEHTRAVVRGPLARFERTFYGGRDDVTAATGLLDDARQAMGRLEG